MMLDLNNLPNEPEQLEQNDDRKFTAREDDGTGLYYYRARYYHPMLGRFVSEDLMDMVNGPNIYLYALNDPLKYVDSMGFQAETSDNCLDCVQGCLRRKRLATAGMIGKAIESNLPSLGIGAVTTAGAAAAWKIHPYAGAVATLGAAGIDIYAVYSVFKTRDDLAARIVGDYIDCLLACRRSFPGDRELWRDFVLMNPP